MEIRVRESCIRCGRCARVCPSQIFVQEEPRGAVSLRQPENCILCGHCVAACPTGSVAHEGFPPERVHAFDRRDLPTPERVELLLAVRRSNRALFDRPVPPEWLGRILRGATALLFIHAPRASRFGVEDANLACQNASLMAEALGVSQIYMGFVLTAVRQDRRKRLNRMLGLQGRRIGAVLACGMPEFLYPNYIDRDPAPRN